MKRRIGCWIALAVIVAFVLWIHFYDQYGFMSAIMIFIILPMLMLPINIIAAFDEQLLIEVPILSMIITLLLEVLTFRSDIGAYFGYFVPTFIVSVGMFMLTRYLKNRLVKQLTSH